MREWQRKETATAWDAEGASLLPTRAEQLDLLLALLVESDIGDGAILDLGIGSGLVAELVLEALPRAELVGVDSSRPMLDLARERLGRFGPRVRVCEGDLAEPAAIDLPLHRYKAAFSIQTVHHLTDRDKAALFAWAAGLVEPGGLVAIVDRVSVEESLFEDWLVVWRRVDPAAPGTFAQHLDALAQEGDRPARLEDQLAWMKAAGLDACCLHLYGNRALLVGRKPR